MDSFLQRMIQRFHDQISQKMSPERRARRLTVMRALARASFRLKNKENEDPLNNNSALPCSLIHSTPLKDSQVTDLDSEEPEMELKVAEICMNEDQIEEKSREVTVPQLVITKIYDLDNEVENEEKTRKSEEFEVNVSPADVNLTLEEDEKHWKSLEVLDETAELEFCKTLEESKLYASKSSLLEDIEADLPSSYSLARPLHHTYHTLTSYRTITRLARREGNFSCPDILEQRESTEMPLISKRQEDLEMEMRVQSALAGQAEKALSLSKSQKFLGLEHLECEKALLLVTLRYNAASRELEKVKMLGDIPDRESFGLVTICDIFFTVENTEDKDPGKYICTATEREHVQASSIVSEIEDGKLHFNEGFKFSNLKKDFIIYIELFKLQFKEAKKTMLKSNLIRRLRKRTISNSNKSLMYSPSDVGGFACVACAELRLDQIMNRENEKCVLQFTEIPKHPVAGTSVNLLIKTDLNIKSKQIGFLNLFKKTWHRRWFKLSGYFLECWLYPEDQESEKPSIDSIYLPRCISEAKVVGMDVCVRPYSFILSLEQPQEELLFSSDSQKEMTKWIEKINLTIEHIRLWKPDV